MPRTVLLLMADPSIRLLLCDDLRRAGLQVLPAASPAEALRLSAQVIPDALVIDADDAPQACEGVLAGALDAGLQPLPGLSGGTAQGHARPALPRARCVVLSRGEPNGWAGPQDPSASALSLRKPIHPGELVAALLCLLRPHRSASVRQPCAAIRFGALEVKRGDPALRWLADGKWRQLDLPHTEHRLLLALAEAAPRGLRREQLRSSVWGDEPVTVRTVDQYVKRLRTRLATVGARDMVRTLRSFGYRLDVEAWQKPADLKS